jgi:curved DNA-binding protein CbpA
MAVNPFDALGLPARPDLTDEQVRAAWRTIAAATHPDRPGGGDVARYTEATAAYAVLRTPWGRSEALADLGAAADDTSPLPAVEAADADGDGPPAPAGGFRSAGPAASAGDVRSAGPADLLVALVQLPARIRDGRPLRLVIRALAATVLSLAVLALIPGQPAAPALVTGLIAWFLLTGRSDLAPVTLPRGTEQGLTWR